MTRFRHGLARSKVYGVWAGMKARCYNPNIKQFRDYGGRGISICDRWQLFDNFFADMGHPPEGMSLERINNDDGYHPGNCRWATRVEQGRNKRGNRIITIAGISLSMTEWGERVGLRPATIWLRIKNGWDEKDAVLTPKLRQIPGMPRTTSLREYAARHGVSLSDEISNAE